MNILHMKYAAEVAKCGSINKAAEVLMVGQPNISRAIKELESGLGTAIFLRSPKGMELTEEGRIFLKYARSILKQIDEVEGMFKAPAEEVRRFSVSAPRSPYISAAFAAFCAKAPACGLTEYIAADTEGAVQNVAGGKSRAGVIRIEEGKAKTVNELLAENELQGRPLVRFELCVIESGECISEGLRTQVFTGEPSGKERFGDKPVIFVPSWAAALELLSENKTAFMVSEPLPKSVLCRYGLVRRRISGGGSFSDIFIKRRDSNFTETESLFVQEIYATAKEIESI